MKSESLLKSVLFSACQEEVNERIQMAEDAIKAAQESANEETKSSMGDKYETGRAMAQREGAKASQHLAQAQTLKTILDKMEPNKEFAQIQFGGIAITSHGNFFVSIPLGKMVVRGETWFMISAASPIGKQLLGKKAGDALSFNGRNYQIEKVL